MKRDGNVGRPDGSRETCVSQWDINPDKLIRPRSAEPIRASDPCAIASIAGHMSASDQAVRNKSLASRGPSTHETLPKMGRVAALWVGLRGKMALVRPGLKPGANDCQAPLTHF